MILHSFIEYLKYRWKAKGRHGIHSPFVYDLVEHVLLDKGPIERAYIIAYPSLPLCYENLASRIAAYYKYQTILLLPSQNTGSINQETDFLLLDESAYAVWCALFDEYFPLLKKESAVLIAGIHKTLQHTAEWKKLCADPRVRLSMDLFGVGLLFFKDEIKEQQYFILKY
jgi:hypothetical protein